MENRFYQFVLLVTIVCVFVVFIAPSVDLPDSALRARQHAANVMFCIASVIVTLLLLLTMGLFFRSQGKEFPAGRASPPLHPLLCTFLV